MVYLRVTSALAAAALLTLVPHAQAQSLPPEGELHVTFTATQVPPVNPMLIGEGKQYVAQNLIMSASNDQGNAVLNNIASRCQMNRLIDTVAKTTEAHGYCVYTDADNDQIFEKCDFLARQTQHIQTDGRHRQIPRSASVDHYYVDARQEYL